jgi:PPP family 3-phenylpropionic acid transporter
MPYWRLSSFYFFYFATLGALVPYWGVYLRSVGFDARQIGELMALLMLSRIVAPFVWGWIADHKGQRMVVVRIAAILAAIAFAGVFVSNSYWWLALVMLVFSFFWNASLPQLEVATLNHLGGEASRYARVRLWGSVGFIVAVVALGALFDIADPWWLLPVLLVLMFSIWLASLAIPEREMDANVGHAGPFIRVFLRKDVFAFLVTCFLMQASHGPYYTFYTIYLSDHGYSKSLIGGLWALGVIAEIVLFLWLHRVRRQFGLRQLLLASFLLAAGRWLVIGYFPQYLALLIAAQLLHAASFGAFHATAVELVHRFFRGQHQTRGQALYGSVSFGIGGALGSFYAGQTWMTLGPGSTYAIAAALAAAAWFVGWRWVRPVS